MAIQYSSLPSTEYGGRSNSFRHPKELLDGDLPIELRIHRRANQQSIMVITVFLASVTASALLGLYIGSRYLTSTQSAIQYGSRYSPLMRHVDMSYHTQLFNGSLMKINVFRSDAGAEADAAWESLGVDYRSVLIPEDEASQSGLNPSHVHVRQKYGGGYPANVEGLHHLHCLNLLRKSLYYNHEYYKSQHLHEFVNDQRVVKAHLTHCLDILRQQLMCTVDVGVLGQVWWNREQPRAFVDFNTKHQCRDFEAIRRWSQEHQLPEVTPEDWLEPPKSEDVLPHLP